MYKRQILCVSVLFAGIFFVFGPGLVFADEAPKPPAASPAQPAPEIKPQIEEVNPADEYRQKLGKVITEEMGEPFEVDTFFRYTPKRDVSAQSGGVGIIEAGTEYSYTLKLFDQLPVELAVGAGYIGIQNTSPVSLPSRLTTVAFGLETTLPFFNFKDTYFRFGFGPSFNSDNWNFKSDSVTIPSRMFLIYQPNPKLILIGGMAVFPGQESVFVPIAGLIYRHSDKLIFNLIPDRPNVSYSFNDKVTLFVEGGIYGDEFKVSKDGVKGVALDYSEMRAGAGINYSPNKVVDLYLSTGTIFKNTLQYRDSLGKVKVKSGLYTEFRVEIGI